MAVSSDQSLASPKLADPGVSDCSSVLPLGETSVGSAREGERGTRARLKQLDVLRSFAVLLVLCAHMYSVSWLQRCGWIGVDLFFVLSGFLVSGLLFNEYRKHGHLKPGVFLLRRGLKIYPAFYVFVAGSVVLIWLRAMHVPLDQLLSEVLFYQNYYGGLWGHTWSLCIEEHFYLLLTACLYLLVARHKTGGEPFRKIPWIFLAVATAVLAARLLTYVFIKPFDWNIHFKPTHLRLDSLLFGVCLAYFHHFRHEEFVAFVRRHAAWILPFSVVALTPTVIFNADHALITTVGFTFVYLGFGGLLMVFLYVDLPVPRPVAFVWRPLGNLLAWMGAYSYSIYLWHLVVASLGISMFRRAYSYAASSLFPGGTQWQLPHLVEFAIYVTASVLVGVVMSKLIEMPVLKLRDRYFPART